MMTMKTLTGQVPKMKMTGAAVVVVITKMMMITSTVITIIDDHQVIVVVTLVAVMINGNMINLMTMISVVIKDINVTGTSDFYHTKVTTSHARISF